MATKLSSDVSSDATAYSVTETTEQWTGTLKLTFCSKVTSEEYRCGDKTKILKGIKRALEKKDTQPPHLVNLSVCSVEVDGDTITVTLAFTSKQKCIDFVENDRENSGPKRALNTYLEGDITSYDISASGSVIEPKDDIETFINVYAKTSIPQKSDELEDLDKLVQDLSLEEKPKSITKVREYDLLKEPLTKDQVLEFPKVLGGHKWKHVARELHALGCSHLSEATIDTIAADYSGHSEQAYQMLRKYQESEHPEATLDRLVKAMDRCGYSKQATDIILA